MYYPRIGFGMWLTNEELHTFAINSGIINNVNDFDGYDVQSAVGGIYIDGSDEDYGKIVLGNRNLGTLSANPR